MAIPEVNVAELESALAGGARLYDVREPDEYTQAHVPGAVLIPLATVAANVERFRGDGTAYIICRSGGRSMTACEQLADAGVAVANVAGGTMGWATSGRTTVGGDQPA
ncbi:MAG: rhodanese-like domain-containing protein [Ilumatobacteraceae bacterium]